MIESLSYAGRRLLPMLQWVMNIPVLLMVAALFCTHIMSVIDPFNGFRVYSVSVPNHCEGENPLIHVTRSSNAFIEGAYNAEFLSGRNGRSAPMCSSGEIRFPYKPRDDFLVSRGLREYFNTPQSCTLPPGVWRGSITWTFKPSWREESVVSIETFPFEVWPKSDARCLPHK